MRLEALMSMMSQPKRRMMAGLLATCLLCSGCGGYPKVDRRTYDFATAMYGVCNAKSPERLAQLVELLNAAPDLPEREARWLQQMADTAQAGDWMEAQRMARQLLADQAEDN